jgi:hypothetical protein
MKGSISGSLLKGFEMSFSGLKYNFCLKIELISEEKHSLKTL